MICSFRLPLAYISLISAREVYSFYILGKKTALVLDWYYACYFGYPYEGRKSWIGASPQTIKTKK